MSSSLGHHVLLLFVLAAGCVSPSSPAPDAGLVDAGGHATAGSPFDAGSLLDAGSPLDDGSTFFDAGSPDVSAAVDAGTVASLVVEVVRDVATAPSPIDVTIRLSSAGQVTATVTGPATASPVVAGASSAFTTRLTPTSSSGEVLLTINASIGGQALEWSKTLLLLPQLDSAWGQPEAVPGSVNTPGYEDGAEVSPDGQWLALTDYSPMDMLSCILGPGGPTPANPACTIALGPSTEPLRPDLPGAWRVSPFDNRCPATCATSNYLADGGPLTNVVVPPLSAYLFHRQADGRFAEPRSVAYRADGCAHLMGLSFASNTQTTAEVVFAFDGPWTSDGHRVQHATLKLGEKNELGEYRCIGPGVVSVLNAKTTTLTPGGSLGNPNARGGYLWVDDEANGDLRYRVITAGDGGLPSATLSAERAVAFASSDTALRRIMPFFHEPTRTLFYSTHARRLDSRQLTGADPSATASWSAAATQVATADSINTPGHLLAIGEPSIADLADGGRELYFIYVMATQTGVNANLGRVSAR